MKRAAAAFLVGLVFGTGLLVSGMTDPSKVLGFLDVTDAWDPSLALVMAAAVAVFALLYRLALKRPRPLLAADFAQPARHGIDARLVVGALLFGVGWGLAGFCPGAAIVSAAFGDTRVWAFVAAMVAGVAISRVPGLKAVDRGAE